MNPRTPDAHSPFPIPRAAIYVRTAPDDLDRPDLTAEGQLATCREDALAQGYEVVQELVDRDWSGASLDRPGLSLLRDYIRSETIDVVIIVHLARLTCDLGHLRVLWHELRTAGVELHIVRYVDPHGDSPGALIASVSATFTKLERVLFAEPLT
jgi:site-specific DNA recombinase